MLPSVKVRPVVIKTTKQGSVHQRNTTSSKSGFIFRANTTIRTLLKMGSIGCPETSVTTNLRCATSQKSEDFTYTVAEAVESRKAAEREDLECRSSCGYLVPVLSCPC